MRIVISICAAFIAFLFTSSLFSQNAASSHIDVGFARIDITPIGPIRMSGHIRKLGRDTTTQFSHMKAFNRLNAKAMAIGTDAQGPTVLITVDLVGIPAHVTTEVAQRLKKKAGLDPSHLAISASHTHHGPEVGGLLNLTMFFSDPPVTGEDLAAIALYVQELENKLEQVALEALKARAPSLLSYGQGTVGFARNRRLIRDGIYVAQQVNPTGRVDHTLPLLTVKDLDGKLRGMFLNYACHCTTVPSSIRSMHGDWNGEAQRQIEENHPEVTAMVAEGCGADQTPYMAGAPEVAAMHGKEIADEVERLLSTTLMPINSAPVAQMKKIELPFEHIPTVIELSQQLKEKGQRAFNATLMLDRVVRGIPIPESITYPIQTWTFGNELAMVFLGGEAVVDYSLRLKKELGAKRMWVNAYSNDVQCYIPTKELLRQGGYEVLGHLPFYNQPSRLSEGIEEMIIGTVHELLPASFKSVKTDDKSDLFSEINQPLVFTAEKGKPVGPTVAYMPDFRAFGYFSSKDRVEWDMNVLKKGKYDVFMEWSISDESAGKEFVLQAGKTMLEGTVGKTGSWETFKTMKIGQVQLSPGKQKLVFKPKTDFGKGALIDLRQIVFLPVK